MESSVVPYLETSKQNVKRKISEILTDQKIKEIVGAAFDFHFKDRNSLTFQEYYCKIVSNREAFLYTPNYFRVFKQKYSLQGIDGNHLDRLEQEKKPIAITGGGLLLVSSRCFVTIDQFPLAGFKQRVTIRCAPGPEIATHFQPTDCEVQIQPLVSGDGSVKATSLAVSCNKVKASDRNAIGSDQVTSATPSCRTSGRKGAHTDQKK